jgi:hypothetical protein
MTNFRKNARKLPVIVCIAIIIFGAIDLSAVTQSQNDAATPPAFNQLAHDIFKQLVEINTTDSVGNVTTAAEAMAKRLRDAGFADKDVIVAPTRERKMSLPASMAAASASPFYLLATWMSWKPAAKTGPPTHSSLSKETDFSMAVALTI